MPAARPPDDTKTGTAPPWERGDPAPVSEREFRRSFGEDLREAWMSARGTRAAI